MDELGQLEERVEKMIALIVKLRDKVDTLESENRKLFEIKAEVAKRIDSIIKKLDLLPEGDKGA